MNRSIPAIVLVLLYCGALTAQVNYSQTNYRFGQAIYADISATGAAIAMTDPEAGASVAPQNIGFDFNFNGAVFTQFMIHADGILKLGTVAPGSSTAFAETAETSNAGVFTSTLAGYQNVLLPFFTNLVTGTGTPAFHVITTGTAPNRVCTIQWKNLRDADNTSGATNNQFLNIEFQVRLYETSNDIEFVFGNFTSSTNTAGGRFAVSGIKASSSSFLSLAKLSSTLAYKNTLCFTTANHARTNGTYAFRNSQLPPLGFSNRFFGQVSNDVGVGNIYYDSIAPLGAQSAGRIEAMIKNEGANGMANIDVTLTITGANNHSQVVTIPTLAAGSSQIVAFAEYNLANKGQQSVEVSVASVGDTRSDNNTRNVKQVITQSRTQTPGLSTAVIGAGFNSASGFIAVKMYGKGSRKIRQIRLPFNSYRNAVNVSIREDEGANGAPSSTSLFSTGAFFTTNENTITIPVTTDVTVTGDYYIVVQQTTATNMVLLANISPPIRLPRNFTSTTGSTWTTTLADNPFEFIVEVFEENDGPDIGIERVVSPGCGYTATTEVNFTLRNFSSTPVDFSATPTTITGFVRNPAGVEVPFSLVKNTGVLAPNGTEVVTALGNYDFNPRGYHLFFATTNLAADVETANDSLRFLIGNHIPVTKSVTTSCPLTQVTLTGPTYLANLSWNADGFSTSGNTRVFRPTKNTLVKVTGTDYRGCVLQDSLLIEVKADGLPPRPTMMFGDTTLSHRNEFKDTVRVQKLTGHTIEWLGGVGTVVNDSALLLNQVAGMQNAKVAVAYTRTADGCSNVSDTLTYNYTAGVLHNSNEALTVCDTSYYDFSGPVGSTGNNFTRTFTPATPGKKMQFSLYKLDLARFASLQVFDGPSTASPRIVALSNAENGNTIRTFISSHETGILTISFSIGSSQSSGWWAGLTCYSPQVYRTVQDGNFITSENWESKLPGGEAYRPAVRPPSKGDDSVFIRHNISLSSSMPMDQMVIEEGAVLNLENPSSNFISIPVYKTVAQPEFLVKGTLNISGRVQIFGENGEMIVPGRLNNFGQIDLDSVVFNGSAPQVLGNFSGASGSMIRLHINNPAGLTLQSDQSVGGLTLKNGLINTDSENALTLTSEAIDENKGYSGSYVNGPLSVELGGSAGDRLFPIGKNGFYQPVILSNSNGSDNTDKFTAEVIEGPPASRVLPAGVDKLFVARHYRVTQNGNTGSDFTITLPYSTNDGVTEPNNLTILKDDGAGNWLDIGGVATGDATGVIGSDVFNGFSDFVLGNKAGPLPVNWLNFTALPQQTNTQLEWRTTQQQQCARYIVERSTNGLQYQSIATVSCLNNQSAQTYLYTDIAPGKGNFYYRIKQVDDNGRYTFSTVKKVTFIAAPSIVIYPNPAKQVLMVKGVQTNSTLILYNAGGNRVLQSKVTGAAVQLQVGHLPAGIYQLAIINANGVQQIYKVQIAR